MDKIAVIIPVHKYSQEIRTYLDNALNSVTRNVDNTTVQLVPMIVGPKDVLTTVAEDGIKVDTIMNEGDTDFCSQINLAAQKCGCEYFSILEFDDTYADKWFSMVSNYFYTHEDVSVFLPINVQKDVTDGSYRFENEIIWASAFSNEIGFIDEDCLQHYVAFNLTGGVFNTNDFIKVGMFKPSIKVAFAYEFLLRLAKKGLKTYVVPKEGYVHLLKREGSLLMENMQMADGDIDKWFRLAKRESIYTDDRKKGIESIKGQLPTG